MFDSKNYSVTLAGITRVSNNLINHTSEMALVKRPSHGKLKLTNSCWQTQVGVCERRKKTRQTRWQTVGDK